MALISLKKDKENVSVKEKSKIDGLNIKSIMKDMDKFFQKFFVIEKESVIGIDFSNQKLKLVELDIDKSGKMSLVNYIVENLEREDLADQEKLMLKLKACYERMRTKTKYSVVSIKESDVLTKKVYINKVSLEDSDVLENDIKNNLLADRVVGDFNDITFDYKILGPSSKNEEDIELVVFLGNKKEVDDIYDIVNGAGIQPKVIEITEHAIERGVQEMISYIPEIDNKVLLLVDGHMENINLSFIKNNKKIFNKDIFFGLSNLKDTICLSYGLSYDEVDVIMKNKSFNELENFNDKVLFPFLINLESEISRGLDMFYTQSAFSSVDYMIISGDLGSINSVEDVLKDLFDIPLGVANPFCNMTIDMKVSPEQFKRDAPLLLCACGLALRKFD